MLLHKENDMVFEIQEGT